MKKILLLLGVFGILFGGGVINTRVVYAAESCGATANVGSDPNGGSDFRVNVRINTTNLTPSKRYKLLVEASGRLPAEITRFTADAGGDTQLSFNMSNISSVLGNQPNSVHFTVVSAFPNPSDPNAQFCQTTDVILASDPGSLPPNTNGNLPGHPDTGEIQCNNNTGINTAIGCIPITDQNALIGFFLKWALGIGGGIAFLLIIFAGFQIMTSRGDPNRLKAGQELMTSAIAGILLLIFSLVILRIIGVDLLKIPGFTS